MLADARRDQPGARHRAAADGCAADGAESVAVVVVDDVEDDWASTSAFARNSRR